MPTLHEVLGGRNLSGVIQTVKPGLMVEPIADFMSDGLARTVQGNTAEYTKVEGTRKTARVAAYGSASQRRQLTGVTNKPVKLIHSVENIEIESSTLQNLESPDGNQQSLGQAEVERQLSETVDLQDNLRAASVMSILATGQVHVDGDGNLLPSSSGAEISMDFEVPSGNKDQLDILGAGNTISASWATATTNIPGDMRSILTSARKLNGYTPQVAFYGDNLPGYFLSNNFTKELVANTPGVQNAFASGQVPDGLFGIQRWIPASGFFFVDNDGTIQSLVDDDNIILCPRPSMDWWGWLNGTYAVPSDLSAQSNISDAHSTLMNVAGKFAYGVPTLDPVGVKMVYGDTFLPVLKVPGALYIGHTTP